MKKVTFMLVLATLLFTGCQKEKKMRILINSVWIVESMRSDENIDFKTPPWWSYNALTLSFVEDLGRKDRFLFQLEDDRIFSLVKIGNHKIDFQDIDVFGIIERSPTWYSGNSSFAISCADLLCNKINRYKMDSDVLILTGKNGEQINLRRKLDF